MKTLYVTKINGKVTRFEDKQPEINNPIFVYENSNFVEIPARMLNSSWKLTKEVFGFYLIDPKGEKRYVDFGAYHNAIEYTSWQEYDTVTTIEILKQKNEHYNKIIEEQNEKLNYLTKRVENALELMRKGHKEECFKYNEYYRNAYYLLKTIL